MVCLVPSHWTSTNPVMKTPKMAPAVEMAYTLPTTLHAGRLGRPETRDRREESYCLTKKWSWWRTL